MCVFFFFVDGIFFFFMKTAVGLLFFFFEKEQPEEEEEEEKTLTDEDGALDPKRDERAIPTVVLPLPQGPASTTRRARLDEGSGCRGCCF